MRVNSARMSLEDVIARLGVGGIQAKTNPRADTALSITEGSRRLRQDQLYAEGLIELQDASSQAVIQALPSGQRALDFCAGGGGKALAMAAQGRDVTAYDIDPKRMSGLPERAERAGARIAMATLSDLQDDAPFDLVLCDAPCSGSGAWRRSPEGKWALTPARLQDYNSKQLAVLTQAAEFVAPGGCLVYATCSLLRAENRDLISQFLHSNPSWQLTKDIAWPVDAFGDGFYTAHLTCG